MGTPSNQTTNSQVYYDPEKQQYYTINQPQESNPILSAFGALGNKFGSEKNRNYITIPSMAAADRFTPKTVVPNYLEMAQLFPALDIGLQQNLQNSLLGTTDNTQSSGAGRFLAPSTSSKGK